MKPFPLTGFIRVWVTGMLAASAGDSGAQTRQHLNQGWEYAQGSPGSTWESRRGETASDNVAWTPVTRPHCFNARAAVDPELRCYQGPGWYRTRGFITIKSKK